MKEKKHSRILAPSTDSHPPSKAVSSEASTKIEIGLSDPSIKSKEKCDKRPVELKLVQAIEHDDIDLRPSTITAAQKSGLDVGFVRLIKKICLLALVEFKTGDIVTSTMLCADIRYGLDNDKPVGRTGVPGLSKGERLNAGTAVLILAFTKEHPGELPLEPLGPNTANLQQYRVK